MVHSCKNCGTSTTNQSFCSRSCATSFNNRANPKRTKTKKCKTCNEYIRRARVHCDKCTQEKGRNADMSLAVLAEKYSKHHRSNLFSLVRMRARGIAKQLGYTKCLKCGYDKHVEIAHVKAISKFDLSTPISVVNSPDNLMPLCPNCHWEYDHGIE